MRKQESYFMKAAEMHFIYFYYVHKQLPMRKSVHKLRRCALWSMPLNPFLKKQTQAKTINNKQTWQTINSFPQRQPIFSAKCVKFVRKSPFNRQFSPRLNCSMPAQIKKFQLKFLTEQKLAQLF